MADGTTTLVPAPALRLSATTWRGALLALGLGLALLGWLFAAEAGAAVRVWNTSTAYNHCWLVGPIAAWLAWQRRHRLAGLAPAPLPAAALLMLPAGLAWLAAERLGIMEGRQLAAMGMLWVLVLAVLGWRVSRAMAAPLLYLVFLVPFGEFATPRLQELTARMIEIGLGVLDIAYHREGMLIDTTVGTFHVAEACAGLRFLIAAIAFGALYAIVMFRSPWRRLTVMVLAVVVPILANGVRALGIVVVAQYLGSAEAAAADHVIYGWGFFSVVMLLLIVAGLPFRQDGAADGPAPAPALPLGAPRGTALAAATGLALALAAAGPAVAMAIDAGGTAPQVVAPRLAIPPGCVAQPEGATLRCAGIAVTVRLRAFPSHVTWRAVSAERWQADSGDTDVSFQLDVPGAIWRAKQDDEGRILAVATWLGGQPAGDGLRSRMAQAWNSLGGGGGSPVLAVLELVADGPIGPTQGRAILQRVLAAQGGEDGLIAQATALSTQSR